MILERYWSRLHFFILEVADYFPYLGSVEIQNLLDEVGVKLLQNCLKRCIAQIGAHADLDLGQSPYDGLVFRLIDTFQWSQDR